MQDHFKGIDPYRQIKCAKCLYFRGLAEDKRGVLVACVDNRETVRIPIMPILKECGDFEEASPFLRELHKGYEEA